MSVVIRVSYNDETELKGVLALLSPKIKSYKVAKKQSGKFKNAYIYLQSK